MVVDAKGNATITTKDGVTATIAAEQLVKDATDVAAKNNGENINLDFEKQTVADLDNLTDADKAGAKAKILAANPDAVEVIFDNKGNATVILKNGKSFKVLSKDIFKPLEPSQEPSGVVTTPQTTVKVDKAQLEASILQLDSLVSQLNNGYKKDGSELLDAAKAVFNNPRATQEEVDAMVKRIAEFIAKVSTSSSKNAVNSEDANNKETKAVGSSVGNTKQSSQKELPNTGTSTFGTILPAMAALLSGVGLFAKKKKEDE